ncbi:unnamed protein product [Protopolystoma xenopodis]|uniref:Uncharacterized protein n=1 Tax=Protopolystoma xenopodis TaxID=117903 RepID=A0A448XLG6_9PLAT|nr:unnamed protein product [Protopolystoma xenopodis]
MGSVSVKLPNCQQMRHCVLTRLYATALAGLREDLHNRLLTDEETVGLAPATAVSVAPAHPAPTTGPAVSGAGGTEKTAGIGAQSGLNSPTDRPVPGALIVGPTVARSRAPLQATAMSVEIWSLSGRPAYETGQGLVKSALPRPGRRQFASIDVYGLDVRSHRLTSRHLKTRMVGVNFMYACGHPFFHTSSLARHACTTEKC